MIDQIGIALTGVIAIAISQIARDKKVVRWACIFGMAGQPFWFYAAIKAGQWGILTLNFLYAGAWGLGIWNHWIKPWRAKRHILHFGGGRS